VRGLALDGVSDALADPIGCPIAADRDEARDDTCDG
jgi:hypothetical protein